MLIIQKMKKTAFVLILAAVLGMPASAAEPAPETSAKAMILVHPASGTVLAEKNAGEPMLIASTTKLMTALVAAETLDLDAEAEIEPRWTGVEGSSMYLRPGERYTVRELLQGLLLASGNDAALSLACISDGDEETFVARMNEKCACLGLEHTHFENPHGLDGPEHFSTAADLAVIMAEVMKSRPLREILAQRACTIHGVVYENHNRLLRTCPGVNAGKTGYTMSAGRCLVTACCRDGMELICVTLSDPEDWEDHAALYDWAYGRYRSLTIPAKQILCSLPLMTGDRDFVPVAAENSLCLCIDSDCEPEIVCRTPGFLFAPVKSGERVGELSVSINGIAIARTGLVCLESCGRPNSAARTARETMDRLIGIYAI